MSMTLSKSAIECTRKGENKMNNVDKHEVFNYLDDLRESGAINMFGAAVCIQEDFQVSKQESYSLLKEWMDTFQEDDND